MQSASTWHGCSAVGQGVDHRRGRRARDGHEVPVRDQAGDDAVGVAVEDPADVRRRLALAQLHLGVEERDRMTAEVVDRHLE